MIDAMYIPPPPIRATHNERGGKLLLQPKQSITIIAYSKANLNTRFSKLKFNKGAIRMQTATKGVAENPVAGQAQPHKILKRIGSTNYEVSIHFSQTSKETVEDKMLRLMLRDVKTISPSVPKPKLTAGTEDL
ncbi:MAG: transposon-encoded TnpW family protein [Defluviitaleaceae bacterium]|nr:transposon-encoded TnpW family protein [Defluviitaleaceae bacterium]